MNAIVLIVVCVSAGLALQRVDDAPRAAAGLNRYVISVAVPALVLKAIPSLTPEPALLLVGSLPWLAFIAGAFFWIVVGRLLRLPRSTVWGLALVTGLGNTAFVGYPVVEALHGEAGLRVAVVVDQAGSFLVFATLGVIAAQLGAAGPEGRLDGSDLLARVLRFPPFVGLVLALVLPRFAAGEFILQTLGSSLDVLASTVSPVALVTVGMRIQLRIDALTDGLVWTAIGLRMVVFPVAAAAMLRAFEVPTPTLDVAVLQLGMPPMVTAGLLAAERGLDPDRCLRAVALGLPVSALTLPILNALLAG